MNPHEIPCTIKTTVGTITTQEAVNIKQLPTNTNEEFNNLFDSIDTTMNPTGYGSTGYLDSIEQDEMPEAVAKFVDRSGRKAIAVKVRVEYRYENRTRTKSAVACFHYRYKDNQGPVVSAGITTRHGSETDALQDLLAGREVVYGCVHAIPVA